MNKNYYIYKFKTPKSNYIYNYNTNMLVKVDKSDYELIDNDKLNCGVFEGNEVIEKLRENGILTSNNIEIVEHPESEFLETTFRRRLHTITLQITQQCNLRCKYCVYSGSYKTRTHSNKSMSIDTAKEAIDFLIKHAIDSEELNIGFYGGEPLLRFNFIKECIEYAEEKAEGKHVGFHITTNATLLKKEMIQFFENHNVILTISLDGNKESHDSNRVFAADGCGTFDTVMENLERIKKLYPEYFDKILFNTVIDPKVDFSCTNSFFSNYDLIKDAHVSAGVINDNYSKNKIDLNEDFIVKWQYELFKLFLYKLNEISDKGVTKLQNVYFTSIKSRVFDRNIVSSKTIKAHPGGPCIPGIQRLFVSTDGTFYPCERVSESSEIMKIGNSKDGFDLDKIYNLLNIGKITQEKCKNCYAFHFCGLCAAFADDNNKLDKSVKLKHCNSIKKNMENVLKDYCMLREFGYDFEEENL